MPYLALITPPVVLNLYVVQGARKTGKLGEVVVGATPYVITVLAMVAALIAFPDLALCLPRALQPQVVWTLRIPICCEA